MNELIKFSGKMLAFSRLTIDSDDVDAVVQAVSAHKNPNQVPVMVHSQKMLDLAKLKDKLWEQNIVVIGVVAGVLDEQATALKMAIFPDGRANLIDVANTKNEPPPNELLYAPLVRSGQTVHHMNGNLVLLGSVNDGAEVVSSGNLYIYGKAQGRLVAGATGNKKAYIICHNFEPALVSVAGTYCVQEDIPKEMLGKTVLVRFSESQGLVFEVITQ